MANTYNNWHQVAWPGNWMTDLYAAQQQYSLEQYKKQQRIEEEARELQKRQFMMNTPMPPTFMPNNERIRQEIGFPQKQPPKEERKLCLCSELLWKR